MSAPNAFESVKPRGPDLDIPARPARKKAGHGVPMTVMPERKALDSKGRPTVGIAPPWASPHAPPTSSTTSKARWRARRTATSAAALH